MSAQDDAMAWLIEQGRNPLELVFIPPAPDLWEMWPDLFKNWTKAKQRKYDKAKVTRQAQLQWALEDHIQAMPAGLRAHLKTLVDDRIAREVKKALDSRQVAP